MSRQARISVADGVYHVTTHGNGAQMIFDTPDEKWHMVDLLGETATKMHWSVYGWCIMGNHYHFLVKTPENNLSEGMHDINTSYGETYNRVRERHGHVFQDRFYSILIAEDSHLLEVARYVVLNPVRAQLVAAPEEWPWSSYASAVLGVRSRVAMDDRELMGMFATDEAEARRLYGAFVHEGIGLAKPGILLTGRSRRWLEAAGCADRATCRPVKRPRNTAGDDTMSRVAALHERGLSLREIALVVGVSHMTVKRYLATITEEVRL